MASPNFQVDSHGRITAGCPGVSPETRDRAESEWLKREYIHASFADREGRRQKAAEPDGDRPTNVAEAQQGIMLHGTEIMKRLIKLNPNLWFEVANADSSRMGIYIKDPMAEGGRRYIVGMYREMNPEFETKLVDDKGEVVKCLRGWRTVLSRLIRKRFISEARAAVLFGLPSRDSRNWQMFTT